MSSPTATLLPPAQLAKMSAADQNSYFATLNAQQAAQERAALNAFKTSINQSNTSYLKKCIDHRAICPVSGGATSATYAPGATLQFNLPSAGGAFVRELEVVVDIKFTPATGTGATYGWTPAGAFAWFSDIYLNYGGNTQAHIRPYFLKVIEMLRRTQWLPYSQVLSGLNADATVTANVAQAQPVLTGGTAAISKFRFRIPLQQHRFSPVGMLPIQGQGTKGQINFTCATTLGAANPDPMQVPVNFTGGTGNAITLDATEKTITVYAIYNDGSNLESKSPMSLNMDGLPTQQYIVDQQFSNLGAGSVQRQRISSLMQHHLAISVIIDGVQSTSFSTAANISSIELDQDSAGQNKFWFYGAANNTSYYDYAEDFRHVFGQDLDTGVIVWGHALTANVPEPDNGVGTQVLDMRSGHWPDVYYAVQVGSVSATNFTPRVETYLFSQNDTGLIIATT